MFFKVLHQFFCFTKDKYCNYNIKIDSTKRHIIEQNESHTTKTCSCCDHISNIDGYKFLKYSYCEVTIYRDSNGA
uniref:zinc ribbon domain-containing protein n=1 Tax=Candidatus Uabimicrobium helgolandensis TaxID=3095367 RepID=UPI003FD6C4B0